MSDFRAGLTTSEERLRGRWTLGATAAAALAVVLAARVLRRASPGDAVAVVLGGVVFGWTVPLVAYSAVARVCRYGRLDDAVRALVRDGAHRRGALAGLVVGTAVRGDRFDVARRRGRPRRAGRRDRAGALRTWRRPRGSARSEAPLMQLCSRSGPCSSSGYGRLAAFLADASAGSSASMIALPFPRAHVRSLLGGSHVLGLPEWQSTGILYALGVRFPRDVPCASAELEGYAWASRQEII